MFDNATKKTLRLIVAGVHLKRMHGLEFAFLVLIDAGLREGVARAALQNEEAYSDTSFTQAGCQDGQVLPE